MNTDNHADIYGIMGTIVFSLLKKNFKKLAFLLPSKSPKTFTELNYTGIIRKKINGIFV